MWHINDVCSDGVSLSRLSQPLFEKPVGLLKTFTELFSKATADLRKLESDTRVLRSIINHSGEWVMSRIWISHVTHMNKSCHTELTRIWTQDVKIRHQSLQWMSHVLYTCIYVNESRNTYEWVKSHIWMSQVTHMDESCHTYGWVMSHMWMSHVTHVNESCHTCEWAVSRFWMIHVTHVDECCHKYEWGTSHIWMSHITHMNESCHTWEWVMSHMWMSHVTHENESCHTCEWVMSHMRISHAAQN